MPRVSVVMPAYNAEKYIGEAIDSILDQTFTDFEFIIVNDGSTDRTKEIIQSYDDPRIVYLENDNNSGIVLTLNKGLDAAQGEYIARMDADDVAVENRLEKQLAVMDAELEIGALGTGTRIFGEGMESTDTHSTLDSDKLKAELLFSTCMCHPSVMLRRSVLEENCIRYNAQFKGAEDFEMWWQIVRVSRLKTIPDVLHCYRIHPNQVTQKKDEEYHKLLLRMLDVRMETLGVVLSSDEKDIFLLYCMGKYQHFTHEKMHIYIDVLAKIIEGNKASAFFTDKALHEVCGLSVTYALNNSLLSDTQKKECYKYAVKKKVYSKIMRFKLFVHRLLRR